MVFVGYLYPGQTLFVQIVACFCIFYILLDTLRVENMVSVKSFIFLYFIQRQCFAFFFYCMFTFPMKLLSQIQKIVISICDGTEEGQQWELLFDYIELQHWMITLDF